MKRKSLKKIPKDRIGYDHWTRSYMLTTVRYTDKVLGNNATIEIFKVLKDDGKQ